MAETVAFRTEDGVTLAGALYLPTGAPPHPAITMAHGFGGTIEHDLRPYAELFAANGFAVLLHDHRGWGVSGGEPRQDIDPWRQIADWRRAITSLADRPEVDPDRIGLWGTSYAGGHALVLGATERRIKAVVAQVPTISGYEQGLRRVSPDRTAALEDAFDADEQDNFHGEPLRRQAIVSADPSVPASYYLPGAVEFYLREHPDAVWRNEITLRSNRAARMYEPGTWVSRVSPTPLLMIVARQDTITVTDLALAAYERALEPKKLVLLPGGHFDPYVGEFGKSSSAALAWFREHLKEAT
ncbi:MAG TPA: alpha/beta hydrolase [Pseudonocardiaceae bacterium]|jgi:hypothetical protein